MKNVNRSERQAGQLHQDMEKSPKPLDGGPKLRRQLEECHERSEEEHQADINWMKHTPAVSAEINLVMAKMKSTLPKRRLMVEEQKPAARIISEFPQFKITPGLVGFCLIEVKESKKLKVYPFCISNTLFFWFHM